MLDVEDFISMLEVSDKEQKRYRNDISAFFEYCNENDIAVSKDSIDSFIELKVVPTRKNRATVNATRTRITRYLTANEERRIEKSMTDEPKNTAMAEPEETESKQFDDKATQAVIDVTENTVTNTHDSTTGEGNANQSNTAKRKQVSVYLLPETYEGIKDLANREDTSIGDILSK